MFGRSFSVKTARKKIDDAGSYLDAEEKRARDLLRSGQLDPREKAHLEAYVHHLDVARGHLTNAFYVLESTVFRS